MSKAYKCDCPLCWDSPCTCVPEKCNTELDPMRRLKELRLRLESLGPCPTELADQPSWVDDVCSLEREIKWIEHGGPSTYHERVPDPPITVTLIHHDTNVNLVALRGEARGFVAQSSWYHIAVFKVLGDARPRLLVTLHNLAATLHVPVDRFRVAAAKVLDELVEFSRNPGN